MSIADLSFIKGFKGGPVDDWKNINGSNVFYIKSNHFNLKDIFFIFSVGGLI